MRFLWQTSCHRLDCKKRIYMQDQVTCYFGGLLCQKGNDCAIWQGNGFFRRVVAFEKTTLWFSPHSLAKFSTIYLLSYIQQFDCYLSGVETYGIILLVENSVLSYTCGGLHEGHVFWIYTSKQSITISWGYRGVLEGYETETNIQNGMKMVHNFHKWTHLFHYLYFYRTENHPIRLKWMHFASDWKLSEVFTKMKASDCKDIYFYVTDSGWVVWRGEVFGGVYKKGGLRRCCFYYTTLLFFKSHTQWVPSVTT